MQDVPGFIEFWEFVSSLGGGIELLALVLVTFLCGTRVKYFYYLAAFTIDKGIGGMFKLIYHDPRPYMAASGIKAYHCSKEFGNPSGHSHSSALIASMLFLDLCHTRCQKVIGGSIALFWAAGIPFSRYLLGVHSLDQIVFGSTLGLWSGLTLHFVLR